MRMPFVKGLEIGGWCRDCTHAARRLTRFSGPGHYCSANHPKWSGWQELHLRPPRSEQGRLLLTIHPEIGCQGWTRTNTVRVNKPSCYFINTTWQFEIGAAGRTSTCIVPLRRRMPDMFDHGSNLKMVGTAGLGFPSLTRWAPQVALFASRIVIHLRPPGPKPGALNTELRSEKMADLKGFAPSAFPQTIPMHRD